MDGATPANASVGDATGDEKVPGRKFAANPVVLRILLALDLDFSDALIRTLVVGALQACPDIIPAFIRDTTLVGEPELSLPWMLKMTLLEDIFRQAPPSLQTLGACAAIRHRVDCALPPTGTATAAFVRGLQSKTPLVRFAALKVFSHMLSHLMALRTNTDVLVAEYGSHAWQQDYAAAVRRYATKLFTMAKKRLPGLEILLAIRHDAFSQSSSHRRDLMQGIIVRVLHLYSQLYPGLFVSAKVDVGKFLVPTEQMLALCEDVQITIIRVLRLHIKHFTWDAPGKHCGGKTPFGVILALVTAAKTDIVRAHARVLVQDLLTATGVFAGDPLEAAVWVQLLQECPGASGFFERLAVDTQKNPFHAMQRLSDALGATDADAAATYKTTLAFSFSPLCVTALDKLVAMGTPQHRRDHANDDAAIAATYIALVWLGIFRIVRHPDVYSKVLSWVCGAHGSWSCPPAMTHVRQHMHRLLGHTTDASVDAMGVETIAGDAGSTITAADAPHQLIDALLTQPWSHGATSVSGDTSRLRDMMRRILAKGELSQVTRLLCMTTLAPMPLNASRTGDRILSLLCFPHRHPNKKVVIGDIVVPIEARDDQDVPAMNPTLVKVPFEVLVHLFASVDMLAQRTVQILLVRSLRDTTASIARRLAGRALASVTQRLVARAARSHVDTATLEALQFCFNTLLAMTQPSTSMAKSATRADAEGVDTWWRDLYTTVLQVADIKDIVHAASTQPARPRLMCVVFAFLRNVLCMAQLGQSECARTYRRIVYDQVAAILKGEHAPNRDDTPNTLWLAQRLHFLHALSEQYAPEEQEKLLTILVGWNRTAPASPAHKNADVDVLSIAGTLLQTLVRAMTRHGHVSPAAQHAILKLSSEAEQGTPDITRFGAAVLSQYFGEWLEQWDTTYAAAMVAKCISNSTFFRLRFEKSVRDTMVIGTQDATLSREAPLPVVVETYTNAIRVRTSTGERNITADPMPRVSPSTFAMSLDTTACCVRLALSYARALLVDVSRNVEPAPAAMSALVYLLETIPVESWGWDGAGGDEEGIRVLQRSCGELLDHIVHTCNRGQALHMTEHIDLMLALLFVVLQHSEQRSFQRAADCLLLLLTSIITCEGGDEYDGTCPTEGLLGALYAGVRTVCYTASAVGATDLVDASVLHTGEHVRARSRVQQIVASFRLVYPPAVDAMCDMVQFLLMVAPALFPPMRVFYAQVLASGQFEKAMSHRVDVVASTNESCRTQHMDIENRRYSVVRLIHALVTSAVQAKASIISAEDVSTLLMAYNASVVASDKLLRRVFEVYESHGHTVGHLAACWGPGSKERRDAESGVHGGAQAGEAVAARGHGLIHSIHKSLDYTRITWCIENFLLGAHAGHVASDEPSTLPEHESAEMTSIRLPLHASTRGLLEQLRFYDPCFVLPLVIVSIQQETAVSPPTETSTLDARIYIESNLIPFAIMCTGIGNAGIRRLAYHALGLYRAALDHCRFKERLQVVAVLDAFKNALTGANEVVSPLICFFIAKAARLTLHPDDIPMYMVVHKFILGRPCVDLEDVPMFYTLFNSSSQTFRSERLWILRLLALGSQSAADYKILRRRRAVDLALHLYDSTASDGKTRAMTTQLVVTLCSVPVVAADLLVNRGLLPWLHSQIQHNLPRDTFVRSSIDDVLVIALQCIATVRSMDGSTLPAEDRYLVLAGLKNLALGIAVFAFDFCRIDQVGRRLVKIKRLHSLLRLTRMAMEEDPTTTTAVPDAPISASALSPLLRAYLLIHGRTHSDVAALLSALTMRAENIDIPELDPQETMEARQDMLGVLTRSNLTVGGHVGKCELVRFVLNMISTERHHLCVPSDGMCVLPARALPDTEQREAATADDTDGTGRHVRDNIGTYQSKALWWLHGQLVENPDLAHSWCPSAPANTPTQTVRSSPHLEQSTTPTGLLPRFLDLLPVLCDEGVGTETFHAVCAWTACARVLATSTLTAAVDGCDDTVETAHGKHLPNSLASLEMLQMVGGVPSTGHRTASQPPSSAETACVWGSAAYLREMLLNGDTGTAHTLLAAHVGARTAYDSSDGIRRGTTKRTAAASDACTDTTGGARKRTKSGPQLSQSRARSKSKKSKKSKKHEGSDEILSDASTKSKTKKSKKSKKSDSEKFDELTKKKSKKAKKSGE
eukprot:m.1015233 g.1015233  ORF g.1015233 m.1015233 type:complete len:2160 (-) comp24076_c0_seq4:1637-8116(-)